MKNEEEVKLSSKAVEFRAEIPFSFFFLIQKKINACPSILYIVHIHLKVLMIISS